MSPATSRAAAAARPRHLPARTCVGCRAERPKAELVRLVLPAEGDVAVDRAGRAAGRGAYLCADHPLDCLAIARRKRALPRAFRTTQERVDADALAAELSSPAATRGAGPPVKEGEPSQR